MLEHNLTVEQIGSVQDLIDNGDISGAWDLLESYGDTYADDAAAVTGGGNGSPWDFAMEELVKERSQSQY